ncbi:Protein of unknown function [Bacillus cytotoxicus]|uniref:Uncharacterized protein n=1 Tax=Bacillus cytotoxicus TaxID=580165 RepID=A0AAX2CEL3_9BACI|nr:Protein of unknown function [Bacillus cytotoxicus]SCN33569.1 Protein of unknown function [Bacillus cytotoxicus]
MFAMKCINMLTKLHHHP